MKKKYIWLSNLILDWNIGIESWTNTNKKDYFRAHELWKHAESLLKDNATEFNRVDMISNLKRCLNQRLKFIEYVYSFKKIAISDSPKGYLEYLESLGLVRPYMLKNLMNIRNDIEHNDIPPPSVSRCRELLDLTWYFLKSTDHLVSYCSTSFLLRNLTDEGEETQYWLNIEIDFELDHIISINGWIPEFFLSQEEQQGFTLVEIKDFHSKKERWNENKTHEDKLDNDFWINGILKPSEEFRFKVVTNCIQSEM